MDPAPPSLSLNLMSAENENDRRHSPRRSATLQDVLNLLRDNGFAFEVLRATGLEPFSRVQWWHGTSQQNALEIQRSGFIPSVKGFCGPGVYLTSNKAKALAWARYASAGRPNHDGSNLLRTEQSPPALICVKVEVKKCKSFDKGLITGNVCELYEVKHRGPNSASVDEFGRLMTRDQARLLEWQAHDFDAQYIEDTFGDGYGPHRYSCGCHPSYQHNGWFRPFMEGDELVLKSGHSASYYWHEVVRGYDHFEVPANLLFKRID